MGIINGSGNNAVVGGAPSGNYQDSDAFYGYFSDFAEIKVDGTVNGLAGDLAKVCYGDVLRLYAQGGTTYEWHRLNEEGTNADVDYLVDNMVQNPYTLPTLPVGAHRFRVISRGFCDLTDEAEVRVQVGQLVLPGIKVEPEFQCGTDVRFDFLDTTVNDLGMISWYVHEVGSSEMPPGTLMARTRRPTTAQRGFSYNAVNHTNDIKYFDITRIALDRNGICEHCETRRVSQCDIEFEANRTPQDPNGCHPLTVDFVSTYLSGYIGGLSYEWDFDGDGTTDHSEGNPTYIYSNFTGVPQTYTPTLTVRNDQGCSQTIELAPITVQPWIHANFAIDTVEGCSPFRQQVVANSMGGIASHIWDKSGTGYMMANSQKGMPADWVFTSTAANTITTKVGLRVTTENGLCHDVYEQPVTVYPTPTTAASISALSDPKCSPLVLALEGKVSGPGKNFRWEESTDGGATWTTISNGEDVLNEHGVAEYKIYNYGTAPEMHRFRFTVTGDYGCGTTVNVGNVTVQPHIDAQFSMDTFVCAPDRLMANLVLYGGANYYSMDWGDGSTPNTYTGITPPTTMGHDYANTTSTTQRYPVTLTVRNAAGCERQHAQPVHIFPQVNPDFTPAYAIDCSPLHVEFSNTSRYADGTPLPNALYEWDFGNGNSSVLEHPAQDFHNEEVNDVDYTVRLVTRSEHGCHDTVLHSVTVQPSVTAYMAVDASSGCSPLKVRFDYKVLPSISSYRFVWDDGSAEEVVSAASATGVIEHTFMNETDAPIVRNVRMVASNTNCSAEMVIPITVHAAITAGYAQATATGCSPLEVQFTDGTQYRNGVAVADALYYWDFGDGNSSIEPSPRHTFVNSGGADVTFTVTQRVTTQQGCVSSSSSTVTVSPFIAAQLAINRCEGCTPLSVDFTYPTHPSVERYEFSWGDGQTTTLTGAQATGSISHTFTNTTGQPETRTVRLTISNAKCSDHVELPIRVYPEIEAGFGLDVAEGCTDLTVHLTNTSRFKGTSGAPMTADDAEYYWDFGDGTQSTEFHPTHVFSNRTGSNVTYTVSLRVRLYQTNLNGERVYTDCQSTTTRTVTVWPFVDATVTLATNQGCSPLPVDFTHTLHPGVATYTFSWDDGTASTTIAGGTATGRASHTFVNQTGAVLTRTVSLAVSNGKSGAQGCTVSDQVQVTVYPEVQADFAADRYEGCTDLDVQLTNTSVYRGTSTPLSGHLSYWKFGDGASAEEHSPAHTYQNDNPDASKICPTELRVVSEHGCTDQIVKNIEVYNRVESHFTLDQPSECTPFDVTFTSRALGASNLEWSFGGAPGLANHPMTSNGSITRTFTNPSPDDVARYDVTLSVTNSHGCPASETQTVTVFPQVIAAFDKSGAEGCSGLTVDFTNLSTGGALVSVWDFGDGNSVSNGDKSPVQHTYHNTTAEARVYTVTLTTINPNGCRDVATQEVTVHPRVVSDFQLDGLEGCTPFRVPISNLSTTNAYTTYQWTFGDGTQSAQMQPGDHTYVNATQAPPVVEQHTLTLLVRYERNGTVCTDSKSAQITVYPHIYPEFTGNFEGCHQPNGLLVQLQNQTVAFNDATTRYIWYLGDPTATDHTMDHDPVHLYRATTKTDDAIYTVKLVSISEHGCRDSVEHQVTVHPRPQAGLELLGDDHASCPPFNVEMSNTSLGTDLTYRYTFGDGTDSTTMSRLNMRHAYQNNTSENVDYTMTLHVTTRFGCEDQVQQTVKVYPAVQASFTLKPEAGCAPHEVQFDASPTRNAYEYRWDFDDGITSSTLAPEHSFENKTESDRIYNVTLRATSLNGCRDEITRPITVYATPQANFAITPPQNTFPSSTFMLDNKSDPASPGWKYLWEFGDGYTSAEKNPSSHTYLTWGPREDGFRYKVKLRIESPNCWDTTSNTIWLYAPRPIASFKSPIYKACSPLEVNLINNSKYGTSYLWDFGDGTTSTEFAPYHVFTYDPSDTINNGNYLVSLTVYGDGGVHFEQQQFQVYQNPTAAFSTSPTTGVIQLPNAAVGFINESKNYDPPLSFWDFGDGTSEYAASPRHEYMGMGEYKVSLWVYQTYDDGTVCADSLSRSPAVWVQAPGTISFPNAFKPSHEGPNGGAYEPNDIKNQVFHPLHKGVDTYRLIIMSRWGEQIFTSKDVSTGWDGYVNGRLAPQGVYVWRATGTFVNGKPFDMRGTVTLIR